MASPAQPNPPNTQIRIRQQPIKIEGNIAKFQYRGTYWEIELLELDANQTPTKTLQITQEVAEKAALLFQQLADQGAFTSQGSTPPSLPKKFTIDTDENNPNNSKMQYYVSDDISAAPIPLQRTSQEVDQIAGGILPELGRVIKQARAGSSSSSQATGGASGAASAATQCSYTAAQQAALRQFLANPTNQAFYDLGHPQATPNATEGTHPEAYKMICKHILDGDHAAWEQDSANSNRLPEPKQDEVPSEGTITTSLSPDCYGAWRLMRNSNTLLRGANASAMDEPSRIREFLQSYGINEQFCIKEGLLAALTPAVTPSPATLPPPSNLGGQSASPPTLQPAAVTPPFPASSTSPGQTQLVPATTTTPQPANPSWWQRCKNLFVGPSS